VPAFVRVPRVPRWPLWAVAVTGAWLGLVGLARVVAPHAALCTLRRITGVPCPGCGATRAVAALAQWDVLRAFAMNPIFVAALLLFVSLMAMRLLAGVAPRLRPGRAALLLAAALVVANWAYVIRTDHPTRPVDPAAAQRRDAPAPAPAAQGGSLPSGTSGG
jgi:hypothetical protein